MDHLPTRQYGGPPKSVVTYQISAKVSKSTAYVTAKRNKLVVPNILTIDRTSSRESTNQRKSLQDKDIDQEHRDLENYFDSTLGVIVLNRTTLPANRCQQYRSIIDISGASLFKSKLGDFSILRYLHENQTIAITLDDKINSCGRDMYRTGIPNIEVLLLKEGERFLHAKHLDTEDMEEEILLESKIRGSLNSVELSLDHIYQNLSRGAFRYQGN